MCEQLLDAREQHEVRLTLTLTPNPNPNPNPSPNPNPNLAAREQHHQAAVEAAPAWLGLGLG